MSALTLFEHDTSTLPLSPKQQALLERLRRRLPERALQVEVRGSSHVLRAAHYIGVLRLGETTIQILLKIYRSPDSAAAEQRAREATANLLHMLAYAGLAHIRESDVTDLLRRESDWFEILTYLFATHLAEEWQHGATRAYQTVEEELPRLRGTWLLATQLRRPDRAHRFSVRYDEFTVDIPLNRVFRFVVERLSRLTRSSANARLLGELRQLLDEVTLLPVVTAQDVDRITLNRLNTHYAPLLNLARLFLDDGALQVAAGDNALFAFVFDMNAVFEGFVAGFLRRHPAAIPEELRSARLAAQGGNKRLYLASSGTTPHFRLKPDLLFQRDDVTPAIADTKYKRLDPGDKKLGISEADFYQMFAYAQRYCCPRVILIYPQTAGSTALQKRFTLQGTTNQQIIAATIGVHRDLGKRAERDALAVELATILSQE
jgi:5-methylcytosine-specific restriction enzyme subunit McrC